MHDCRKTKMILVDLVFGELEAGQQQHALAEVRSCPTCSQEYQSMLATLHVFDQTADAVMPEESYWTGYEARLRTRLAESIAQNRRERLAKWVAGQFAWLLAKPAIPAAVAIGLILFIAISLVWFSRLKTEDPQFQWPDVVTSEMREAHTHQPQSPDVIADVRRVFPVKPRQQRPTRAVVQPKESEQDNLIAVNLPPSGITRRLQSDAAPGVVPASHFEKAQLLLRSFRNARTEGKNRAIDLSYEKREAGKLIYDNILLRREAEAKGYLPVEEALNSLEPLLLDIANLPDKPSRGEVRVIRERIQKQEMIATLQIIASGTERFSPPVLLNP